MRKTICIFNPEHDMALASSSRYYMTPVNIVKMKSDLSLLPIWYLEMSDNEMLVLAKDYDIPFVDNLKKSFCCLSNVSLISSLKGSFDDLQPWGWDLALLSRVMVSGMRLQKLPSFGDIEEIKRLSSRCNAVKLLSLLNLALGKEEPKSFCLSSLEVVKCFIEENGTVMLKAPWSGSGRGVRKIDLELTDSDSGWVRRVIRTQGCVIGEPFYKKVIDFAMEYSCVDSDVKFIGYSVFETDSLGAYKCSILDSDEALEKIICSYVSRRELDEVKKQLEKQLCELYAKEYDGVLGVDMMICKDDNGYWIHPCVEVNVRMNMGIVARRFYDRFVSADSKGVYHVEHYFSKSEAVAKDCLMKKLYPLVIINGRIESGYMSLTAVNDDTRFQIYVLVVKK